MYQCMYIDIIVYIVFILFYFKIYNITSKCECVTFPIGKLAMASLDPDFDFIYIIIVKYLSDDAI